MFLAPTHASPFRDSGGQPARVGGPGGELGGPRRYVYGARCERGRDRSPPRWLARHHLAVPDRQIAKMPNIWLRPQTQDEGDGHLERSATRHFRTKPVMRPSELLAAQARASRPTSMGKQWPPREEQSFLQRAETAVRSVIAGAVFDRGGSVLGGHRAARSACGSLLLGHRPSNKARLDNIGRWVLAEGCVVTNERVGTALRL